MQRETDGTRRCMEHSIDLSACHFVQEVSPSSTSKLLKKIKKAFDDADISDTVDLDALDLHLAAFDFMKRKEKVMRREMFQVLIFLNSTLWTLSEKLLH
jgi:hypothetical protein